MFLNDKDNKRKSTTLYTDQPFKFSPNKFGTNNYYSPCTLHSLLSNIIFLGLLQGVERETSPKNRSVQAQF